MSRPRSALPPFDSSARLPLALALLLAAALAFQLAVPTDQALPVAGAVRGGAAADGALPVPPVPAASIALRARLFTPPPVSLPGAAPPAGPVVLGSIRIGPALFVLVQAADGQVTRRAAGASIGGWRIAAIDPGGVRLVRGKDRTTLAFGGRIPAPPAAQPE